MIALNRAGSPTDPSIKWTHLKPRQIADHYEQQWSETISTGTIKRIMKDLNYKRRRPNKCLAEGKSPFRAAQFKLIFYFAFLFSEMEHHPILSMDTKKKEVLGDLGRAGRVWSKQAPFVHDHDYKHLQQGKVVPAGLYDMKRNEGYVSIGTNSVLVLIMRRLLF